MESAKSQRSFAGLIDWQIIAAVLFSVLIVAPRSYVIARAHSETYDAQYHITRGLSYFARTISKKDLSCNDPPIGEALIAVPVLVTNLLEGRDIDDDRLYDVAGRAETIAVRIALWNTVLFQCLIATVFIWLRQLYCVGSAWLAVTLLSLEPNFAAHIPLGTIDVVAVTGIVIACFFIWRYFESPSISRLIVMGTATGIAMTIKHTAVILPGVIAVSAGLRWGVYPWLKKEPWVEWKAALSGRIRAIALIGLVTAVAIALSTANEVMPLVSLKKTWPEERGMSFLHWHLPGGTYLRAFKSGMDHGRIGHECYLLGEYGTKGWWYYFPVVATYKVPIGIALIFALSVLMLWWTPLRWEECGLIIPCIAWLIFILNAKINIGFRHFLPAYTFLILLACRNVWRGRPGLLILYWIAAAAAGLHSITYHPDYLTYINFPRNKTYLDISDSNVDWGQGLKQLRHYLDSDPDGGRKVWFCGFGTQDQEEYYLGDKVSFLSGEEPPPTSGLLVISPVQLLGIYNPNGKVAYSALRNRTPDAVIGHSLLVFDLDRDQNKGISPSSR